MGKIGSIEVVNKHRLICTTPDDIYVGRGSPLGNPYHISEEIPRGQAIEHYKPWLIERINAGDEAIIGALDDIAFRVLEGKKVRLVCFCKPAACHGDFIKSVVEKKLEEFQAHQMVQEALKPQKIYAGIGSRDTPEDVCEIMERIGEYLGKAGWILRSGFADGADLAFCRGADRVNGAMEIYLPWPGFNGAPANDLRFIVPEMTDELMAFAGSYHPNWQACKAGVRKLHARNTCQILGRDPFKDPIKAAMVICWTLNGQGQGGTGQALRIAQDQNIPIFDLAIPGTDRELCDFVNQMEGAHAYA